MKIISLALLCVGISFAQSWPTTGLAELYDMRTVSSGALVDSSGNGNNATIGSGTTQGATGTTCNGTSDYIAQPAVLAGNQDFTVIAFVSSTLVDAGFMWAENDSGATTSASLGLMGGSGAGGSIVRIYGAGSGGADWAAYNAPSLSTDWHMFYLQRSRATGVYGILDQNWLVSRNIGNITSITTTLGGICARNTGSGQGLFWSGTIGYLAVYTRALGLQDAVNGLPAAYAAGRAAMLTRGVYMPDLITSVYPAGVYTRQGVVLPATSAGGYIGNEHVLYTTTDCQLVSNPCFQMVLDGGGAAGAGGARYYEATLGSTGSPPLPGTWTEYGTPLLTGVSQCAIAKIPTNYYLLSCANAGSGVGTALNVYKSTAINTPNSYSSTPISSNIVTSSGLGVSNVNNSALISVGSTLYLAFDTETGSVDSCGAMTSSNNGVSWTLAAFPTTGLGDTEGCQGPDLHYFPNNPFPWVIWNHGCISCSAGSVPIPSLYRRQATSFASQWQRSAPAANSYQYNASIPDLTNSAPDESNQLASFTHVDVNGVCYGFYFATDASAVGQIKLITANMPCAVLAMTGGGASTDVP